MYCFENDSDIFSEEQFKTILDTTNYCYYLLLKTLINTLNIDNKSFKEFEKSNLLFVAFDIHTGRCTTSEDYIKNIAAILENDVDKKSFNEMYFHEFIRSSKEDFLKKSDQGDYISLEQLIKDKEKELEGL